MNGKRTQHPEPVTPVGLSTERETIARFLDEMTRRGILTDETAEACAVELPEITPDPARWVSLTFDTAADGAAILSEITRLVELIQQSLREPKKPGCLPIIPPEHVPDFRWWVIKVRRDVAEIWAEAQAEPSAAEREKLLVRALWRLATPAQLAAALAELAPEVLNRGGGRNRGPQKWADEFAAA